MIRSFTVVPAESVGDIKFGMTREAVRAVLGAPVHEFRKSRFSVNTTDDFGFLHVFYTAQNQCEAIELFSECALILADGQTIPAEREEFVQWLLGCDPSAEISDSDAVSKALSLGVSFLQGRVESILFGREGYYAD